MAIRDKDVKDAIGAILQAGSGASTRIVKRWKLALSARDWMAVLRSVQNDKTVDGWYVTRVKRRSKKKGANHFEYNWTYALWYFRSYSEGNAATNSEDELNELLERVAEELENAPKLNIDGSAEMQIDDHSELQVENIDLIDSKVHVAQCFLTVNLTKQG